MKTFDEELDVQHMENLKRAAEFLEIDFVIPEFFFKNHPHYYPKGDGTGVAEFNPHEDANLLKQMEQKLDHPKYEAYIRNLWEEWSGSRDMNSKEYNMCYFMQWLTYKQELCFEKLMEVI